MGHKSFKETYIQNDDPEANEGLGKSATTMNKWINSVITIDARKTEFNKN